MSSWTLTDVEHVDVVDDKILTTEERNSAIEAYTSGADFPREVVLRLLPSTSP